MYINEFGWNVFLVEDVILFFHVHIKKYDML